MKLIFLIIFYVTINLDLHAQSLKRYSTDSVTIMGNYDIIDTSYFKSLDSFFYGYNNFDKIKIFCLGEWHGQLQNYNIFINLFKYLNSRYNYKNIFLESGTAVAHYYNNYVLGYDSVLNFIEYDKGDYFKPFKEANLNILNSLKEINKTKSDFDKIRFYSIDPACFTYTSLKFLYKTIEKQNQIPEFICDFKNQINNHSYNDREIRKLIKKLNKSIFKDSIKWKCCLSNDFMLFRKVICELYFSVIIYNKLSHSKFLQLREAMILENFKSKINIEGKSFFQFGLSHFSIPISKTKRKKEIMFLESALNNRIITRKDYIAITIIYNKYFNPSYYLYKDEIKNKEPKYKFVNYLNEKSSYFDSERSYDGAILLF